MFSFKVFLNKHLRPVLAFIILAIAILACASPVTGGETPSPSSDTVATVIAQTLQAITPEADGQLYFFFLATNSESNTRTPLQLVRSAPDGVTGRTVISEENFRLMNEALWAPDASFVVVAMAPIQEVYQGGQAEVVYLDGRPPVVLTTFAQQMKWGP